MKFIRDLIGKKQAQAEAETAAEAETETETETAAAPEEKIAEPQHDPIDPRLRGGELSAEVNAMLTNVNAKTLAADAPSVQAPAVNIWDMDSDDGSTALPDRAPVLPKPSPALASEAAARSPARSRRTKTRLIGFDKSDGSVVDLFNDAPKVVATQRARFPVGWITVVAGPGRGESFALLAGMNPI